MTGMPESGVRYMATVGMFDGVHLGHAFALRSLAALACERGLKPLVLTFDAHPLATIAPGRAPSPLTDFSQKKDLISRLSADMAVQCLDFGHAMQTLSGAGFLELIHNKFGVDAFAMGYNNHIGHDRATPACLSDACIPVVTLAPFGHDISSSHVRRCIAEGNVAEAARLLGRPYSCRGTVVHGRQLGRTIGFPTANIKPLNPGQLLPAGGVYAVDVRFPSGIVSRGMANIGRRPTVESGHAEISFEVNIFDYSGDLYGSVLEIEFLGRLRDEKAFASLDELRRQLGRDMLAAKIF